MSLISLTDCEVCIKSSMSFGKLIDITLDFILSSNTLVHVYNMFKSDLYIVLIRYDEYLQG